MFVAIAIAAALAVSPPTAVVKDGNDQVQKLLNTKDASVDKLASKADEFVDFAELAKRALGREWEKLNRKQQDEFAGTMKGLLRASYAQKAIGQGTADVAYGAESVKGNEASVKTTIAVKKDKFPVEYRLYRASEKAHWKIYDVITDDVSLVGTYRDQFRKLIAEKGYEGLLTTLRNKKEQMEKAQAPTVSN